MIKPLLSAIFLLIVSVGAISAQSSVEQSVKSARDQFYRYKETVRLSLNE